MLVLRRHARNTCIMAARAYARIMAAHAYARIMAARAYACIMIVPLLLYSLRILPFVLPLNIITNILTSH